MGTTVNSNGTNIQIKDSYKGSGNYGNIIGEYDKSITTTGDYTENGEAKIEEMDLSASVEQDTNSDGIINFDVWNNYYETATKYLTEKRKTLEDMIIVSNDDWKTMKDKYPLLKSEASGFLNIFGSGKKIVSPEEIEARAEKNGGVLPADWLAKGITFEDYEKQYNEYIQEMTGMSYDEYKLELENIENTSQALKLKSYEFKQIEKQEEYKEIAATDEFQKYANENIDTIDDSISEIRGQTLEERGSNALGGGTGKSANQNINYYYEYLTQDEKIMYMYLYDTKGRGFAESFLDAMADSLNQRKGFAEAQKVIEGVVDEDGNIDWGKAAKLFGDGTVDGMWNFCHDYVHFFDFGNDDVVMTDKQYKQMLIVQELSQYSAADQEAFNKCLTVLGFDSVDDFYTMGNDIGNTILPSLTGVGVIGAIATGISSAGRSKDQAIVSGNNTASSYAYGLTVGITDGSMQYFLGNIEGIGKSVQPGFQGLVRQSLATGASVVSEGVARGVILGEDVDYNEVLKQATQAMVTDMASSIIRNGAGKIIRVGKDKIFDSSDGYVENITADNDTVQTNRVIEESDTSLHPQNSGRNRDIDRDLSLVCFREAKNFSGGAGGDGSVLYGRNQVLKAINEYVDPNSPYYHNDRIFRGENSKILAKYTDVELRKYLQGFGFKFDYDITASPMIGDINKVVRFHDMKYKDPSGGSNALYRLEQISDTNSPYYGRYDTITSQNGAREILSQYTPEQIAHYLVQIKNGVSGSDVMSGTSNYGAVKTPTSNNGVTPTMTQDLNKVIQAHDARYGNSPGAFSALKVLEEISDPNSSNYGRYDAITSQNGAREIAKQYTPEQIRAFVKQVKGGSSGSDVMSGTNTYGAVKTPTSNNGVTPTMTQDLNKVIQAHDARYGNSPGAFSALKVLEEISDPNSSNYGRYDAITSQNGAREIAKQYTPEQIRAFVKQVKGGSSGSDVMSGTNTYGAVKTPTSNNGVTPTMTQDLNKVIQAHDARYGNSPGAFSALKVLEEISDPNSSNYGRYDAITSQNGAREIAKQYTPEQIRAFVKQVKGGSSGNYYEDVINNNSAPIVDKVIKKAIPDYENFEAIRSHDGVRMDGTFSDPYLSSLGKSVKSNIAEGNKGASDTVITPDVSTMSSTSSNVTRKVSNVNTGDPVVDKVIKKAIPDYENFEAIRSHDGVRMDGTFSDPYLSSLGKSVKSNIAEGKKGVSDPVIIPDISTMKGTSIFGTMKPHIISTGDPIVDKVLNKTISGHENREATRSYDGIKMADTADFEGHIKPEIITTKKKDIDIIGISSKTNFDNWLHKNIPSADGLSSSAINEIRSKFDSVVSWKATEDFTFRKTLGDGIIDYSTDYEKAKRMRKFAENDLVNYCSKIK